MFQFNTLFLQRFGWTHNMWNYVSYIYVSSDRVFGILQEDDKVYFLKSIELQQQIEEYKYLSLPSILSSKENIEEKIEIKSNAEMVSLIKKHDACKKDYQRHFKLSSILNNK